MIKFKNEMITKKTGFLLSMIAMAGIMEGNKPFDEPYLPKQIYKGPIKIKGNLSLFHVVNGIATKYTADKIIQTDTKEIGGKIVTTLEFDTELNGIWLVALNKKNAIRKARNFEKNNNKKTT